MQPRCAADQTQTCYVAAEQGSHRIDISQIRLFFSCFRETTSRVNSPERLKEQASRTAHHIFWRKKFSLCFSKHVAAPYRCVRHTSLRTSTVVCGYRCFVRPNRATASLLLIRPVCVRSACAQRAATAAALNLTEVRKQYVVYVKYSSHTCIGEVGRHDPSLFLLRKKKKNGGRHT